MTPTPSEVCDAAHNCLKEHDCSVGEFGTVGPEGPSWSVDAAKGDRRVTVYALTLAEAYRRVIECV